MASRDFWLKLKMILGAVIIFALCLGFALWMITPARGQFTGPPMSTYMDNDQLAKCSEWLSEWLDGEEARIDWPVEWHDRLCEPIGTLTCEKVKLIQEKYCEEEKAYIHK